jgi:hypothetical protein
MEIDNDIYVVNEYFNSVLSPNLQKMIIKYIFDTVINMLKNGDLYIFDYFLRKQYEIKYLDKFNCLSNEFNKSCYLDNKVIINFKQEKHINEFSELLSKNHLNYRKSKYTNYGTSLIISLNGGRMITNNRSYDQYDHKYLDYRLNPITSNNDDFLI